MMLSDNGHTNRMAIVTCDHLRRDRTFCYNTPLLISPNSFL